MYVKAIFHTLAQVSAESSTVNIYSENTYLLIRILILVLTSKGRRNDENKQKNKWAPHHC